MMQMLAVNGKVFPPVQISIVGTTFAKYLSLQIVPVKMPGQSFSKFVLCGGFWSSVYLLRDKFDILVQKFLK